jgi:hypothetical protein
MMENKEVSLKIHDGILKKRSSLFKGIANLFSSFSCQVTGVVGRAETLSSVFFLAAFIFYTKSTRQKKTTGKK